MFSASRDLAPEDIKAAMTTKHFDLVQFAEKYSVSIEWLILGTGRIADGGAAPIDEEAEPATIGRSRKTAEVITAKGAGPKPRASNL